MSDVVVASNHGHVGLTLTNWQDSGFIAKLYRPDLRAECHVNDVLGESRDLIKLFKDMQRDWKGWEGELVWSSLGDEFSIRASNDGLGHIHLRNYLHHRFGLDEWSVSSDFMIEVAHLRSLARQIEQFFRY